jgi:hypothetical protein
VRITWGGPRTKPKPSNDGKPVLGTPEQPTGLGRVGLGLGDRSGVLDLFIPGRRFTSLPASQRYRRHVDRWKRYEKPQPGHRVQIDVKFVAPLKGSRKKHYQFTAIDDCTRIRVLRIYDRLNQRTAIRFVDYVLEKLPFAVEVIQTDNGAEFQSQFHYHVLDAGIGHVYIKPAFREQVEPCESGR